MRIKEDSIKNLLDSISIVDVISDYVQLKKRGKNYVGLCPFHNEKTPSFTVSEEKGMFHCFGCGEGGNTLSFLMKYEKYNYVDAIEELAKKFNVQLDYEDGRYYEKDIELEKLYDYSRLTARYFYENLTKTNEGENALKYLHQRGLSDDGIKNFGLGYSLSSWEGLVNFIRKNNYESAIFEKLGLILKREDGNYYDRFRGRIIFPIFSASGRIIAFGGRLLTDEENQPKYLNSPESRIYIKGKTLYGLFQSKDEIRKKDSAILVEGYMDLIALYQAGFRNVVASAGTSLTSDQVYAISRLTKNIIIIYDSDESGQKAVERASELMLEEDVDFKIVTLPEGEDPDSFVKIHGEERFKLELQTASNYIDFVTSFHTKEKKSLENSDKLRIINRILELTSKVRDPIRRSLFIKYASEKFKMRESALAESLGKYLVRQTKFESVSQKVDNKKAEDVEEKFVYKNIPEIEKSLLQLMFSKDRELCDFIFLHIPPEDLTNEKTQIIAKTIQRELERGIQPEEEYLINILEDEDLRNLLAELVFEKYKISKSWNYNPAEESITEVNWKIAEDLIKKFKSDYLEKQIYKNQVQLKSAVDMDEIKKLMEIDKMLKQEIIKIKSMKFREN
jgi:DNA primase